MDSELRRTPTDMSVYTNRVMEKVDARLPDIENEVKDLNFVIGTKNFKKVQEEHEIREYESHKVIPGQVTTDPVSFNMNNFDAMLDDYDDMLQNDGEEATRKFVAANFMLNGVGTSQCKVLNDINIGERQLLFSDSDFFALIQSVVNLKTMNMTNNGRIYIILPHPFFGVSMGSKPFDYIKSNLKIQGLELFIKDDQQYSNQMAVNQNVENNIKDNDFIFSFFCSLSISSFRNPPTKNLFYITLNDEYREQVEGMTERVHAFGNISYVDIGSTSSPFFIEVPILDFDMTLGMIFPRFPTYQRIDSVSHSAVLCNEDSLLHSSFVDIFTFVNEKRPTLVSTQLSGVNGRGVQETTFDQTSYKNVKFQHLKKTMSMQGTYQYHDHLAHYVMISFNEFGVFEWELDSNFTGSNGNECNYHVKKIGEGNFKKFIKHFKPANYNDFVSKDSLKFLAIRSTPHADASSNYYFVDVFKNKERFVNLENAYDDPKVWNDFNNAIKSKYSFSRMNWLNPVQMDSVLRTSEFKTDNALKNVLLVKRSKVKAPSVYGAANFYSDWFFTKMEFQKGKPSKDTLFINGLGTFEDLKTSFTEKYKIRDDILGQNSKMDYSKLEDKFVWIKFRNKAQNKEDVLYVKKIYEDCDINPRDYPNSFHFFTSNVKDVLKRGKSLSGEFFRSLITCELYQIMPKEYSLFVNRSVDFRSLLIDKIQAEVIRTVQFFDKNRSGDLKKRKNYLINNGDLNEEQKRKKLVELDQQEAFKDQMYEKLRIKDSQRPESYSFKQELEARMKQIQEYSSDPSHKKFVEILKKQNDKKPLIFDISDDYAISVDKMIKLHSKNEYEPYERANLMDIVKSKVYSSIGYVMLTVCENGKERLVFIIKDSYISKNQNLVQSFKRRNIRLKTQDLYFTVKYEALCRQYYETKIEQRRRPDNRSKKKNLVGKWNVKNKPENHNLKRTRDDWNGKSKQPKNRKGNDGKKKNESTGFRENVVKKLVTETGSSFFVVKQALKNNNNNYEQAKFYLNNMQ